MLLGCGAALRGEHPAGSDASAGEDDPDQAELPDLEAGEGELLAERLLGRADRLGVGLLVRGLVVLVIDGLAAAARRRRGGLATAATRGAGGGAGLKAALVVLAELLVAVRGLADLHVAVAL